MACCAAKKRWALAALLAVTAGCKIEDVYVYPDGRTVEQNGEPAPAPSACKAGNNTEVFGLLQSSTWVMAGADIPSHPNGFDENINFGQATQCLHRVQMDGGDGAIGISSTLGTLNDAPRVGDVGECDRATSSGTELRFDTTAVLIENVKADCFDITLTYSGFGQEGRGAVSADCSTVELELFFRDQAIGHRCADGEVGASSVTLNEEAFTGNAVQTYRRSGT